MLPFKERTFEGAYQRTALGMAAYAIIVLKIFSTAFAKSISHHFVIPPPRPDYLLRI